MSRFHQTDRPIFVEDFIFRPPYELMDRSLQINQEGLDNAVSQATLLGQIPVDYIGESPEARAKAEALIDRYTKDADDMAALIQQDPMNWRKHSSKLSDIRNRLSKDFQTGELSKLRQSKENYDKVMTHLNSKDFDPTIRDAAKDKLLREYNTGVGDGRLFEDRTFINRRNLIQEFGELVTKHLGITTDKTTRDLIGKMKIELENGNINAIPGYIRQISETKGSNAQQISNALQGFINEPGVQAYLKQMQELELENYFEKRPDGTVGAFINPLNEDGSINTATSLSSLFTSAPGFIKTVSEFSDNINPDSRTAHLESLAQRNKEWNHQVMKDAIPVGERTGDFDLALTNLDNQDLLSETLDDVLKNASVINMLTSAGINIDSLNQGDVRERTEKIVTVLTEQAEILKRAGGDVSILQTKIDEIGTSVKNIINTTAQSWRFSRNFNNEIELQKEVMLFNKLFRENTQAIHTFAVEGAFNRMEKYKIADLSNKSFMKGNGVPGTEYTEVDGTTVVPIPGTYKEYYPPLNHLGLNTVTGRLEIYTGGDSPIRAITLTPSQEQAIPLHQGFIEAEKTGSIVPTEGVGILTISLIGNVHGKDGISLTTTPTSSISSRFKTQGESSFAVSNRK